MQPTLACSDLKIGDLLEAGHSGNLQQAAVDLSQSIAALSGESGRLRLLTTSANIALLFVRNELQLSAQPGPPSAERKKQAELAITQAATLSGSIAVLSGEDPAGIFCEGCLTLGATLSQQQALAVCIHFSDQPRRCRHE